MISKLAYLWEKVLPGSLFSVPKDYRFAAWITVFVVPFLGLMAYYLAPHEYWVWHWLGAVVTFFILTIGVSWFFYLVFKDSFNDLDRDDQ